MGPLVAWGSRLRRTPADSRNTMSPRRHACTSSAMSRTAFMARPAQRACARAARAPDPTAPAAHRAARRAARYRTASRDRSRGAHARCVQVAVVRTRCRVGRLVDSLERGVDAERGRDPLRDVVLRHRLLARPVTKARDRRTREMAQRQVADDVRDIRRKRRVTDRPCVHADRVGAPSGSDDRRHEARDGRFAPVDDRAEEQRQAQHTTAATRRAGPPRLRASCGRRCSAVRCGVLAVRRRLENVVGGDAERPCAVARGERADAGRGRDVDRPRAGRVAFATSGRRSAAQMITAAGWRTAKRCSRAGSSRTSSSARFSGAAQGVWRRCLRFRIVATRFSDDSRARDAATARPRRPAAPMRRTVGRSVDEVGFGMGGHSGDWDVLEVAFDTRATVAGA